MYSSDCRLSWVPGNGFPSPDQSHNSVHSSAHSRCSLPRLDFDLLQIPVVPGEFEIILSLSSVIKLRPRWASIIVNNPKRNRGTQMLFSWAVANWTHLEMRILPGFTERGWAIQRSWHGFSVHYHRFSFIIWICSLSGLHIWGSFPALKFGSRSKSSNILLTMDTIFISDLRDQNLTTRFEKQMIHCNLKTCQRVKILNMQM